MRVSKKDRSCRAHGAWMAYTMAIAGTGSPEALTAKDEVRWRIKFAVEHNKSTDCGVETLPL